MAIKFLSNESIDGTLEVGSFTVSGSGIVAAVGMTLQVDAGNVNAITIDNVGTVTFGYYTYFPNYLFHEGDTDTRIQFTTGTITLRGDSGITLDGPVTANETISITGNLTASRLFSGDGGNKTNPMIANGSDQDTGIFFPAANTMAFTAGDTEALRFAGANSTFAGSITVSGISSTLNTGNSGAFVTNDTNNYPRISTASANIQLGLFRTTTGPGGVYMGGFSGGFEVRNGSTLAPIFNVDQSGNGDFAGSALLDGLASDGYRIYKIRLQAPYTGGWGSITPGTVIGGLQQTNYRTDGGASNIAAAVDFELENNTYGTGQTRISFKCGGVNGVDSTEKMRIDSSGNVGIGTEGTNIVVTGKGLGIQNIGQDTTASMRLTGANATGNPGVATYTELKHYGEHLRFGINHNGGTDVITINSSKNVGIGTESPIVPVHIVGAAVNNPSNGNGGYEVMQIFDNTSYATGVGGGIGFGGNFTGSNSTIFSEIRGIKENATDNNYAGALIFSTRANGANITERMRINSQGQMWLGGSYTGSDIANGNTSYMNNLNAGSFSILHRNSSDVYVHFNSYYTSSNTYISKYSGRGFMLGYNAAVDTGFFFSKAPNTTAGQNQTFSQVMTVGYGSSNNVGIGTTSPGYKLDVNGNMRSSTVTVYDGMGGTETGIGASAAGGYLRLYTGGVNRVTVQSTAETMVLYGQDTIGSNYLQFRDSAGTAQGYIGFGASASDEYYIVQFKNAPFNFYINSAVRGSISTGGTLTMGGDVVAYGSPSDKRLKENIKPIISALDKVIKLQGVTFDWKDKKQEYDQYGKPHKLQEWKNDIGFIAQDVQKVVPELVRENEDGMLSMRHQGVAPILLEAIKELKAEIEELKNKPCACNNCNCKE
jgi:hypothetical protein